MKKYLIPLLLQIGACGVDQKDIAEKPTIVETTKPREPNSPALSAPSLSTPELQPVFYAFGDNTGEPKVRQLNARENREAEKVIERARLLAPYAAQLTEHGIMADKQKAHTKTDSPALYKQFVDKAQAAVEAQHLLIEPGLSATAAYGLYHSQWIKHGETESRNVVYTFRKESSTWCAGGFIHEIAHGTFPSKHDLSSQLTAPAALGQHVVTNEDHVYSVGKAFEIVEGPIQAVVSSIQAARSGQADPRETVQNLLAIQALSDDDWSEKMLEAITNAYKDYLDIVGISQSELRTILQNQQYREICKAEMKKATEEFVLEVNLDAAELSELQSKHGIQASSDELHIVMIVTMVPIYHDTPEGRRAADEEQARKIRKSQDEIHRVNAAVRRTTQWK